MIRPRAITLLALALAMAGCAARSATTPSPTYSPSAQSSASVTRETTSGGSLMQPRAATQHGTLSVMSAAPPGSGVPQIEPDAIDENADREARIAQWEVELDRQRASLSASLAQCRDICSAAGNVCTAAAEICRLTGDLTRANARDARCVRARTACLDAGRRRDGSCPVCPAR